MPHREIHAAVRRILDFREVDWDSLDIGLGEHESATIDGLKLLNGVARGFHDALASPNKTLEPLFRFGCLEVRALLAKGATAEVYSAYDALLDRDVALKLRAATSELLAHQFLAEGRRLARIRHPNVVTVYGAAIEGTRVGISMELVRGPSLQARFELGAIPLSKVVYLGATLCSALEAVHAAGIVHGDVKPSNIILEAPGQRVVLADFGAAHDMHMPAMSAIHGTLNYIAPEVIRGAMPSPLSDLYSVGVLMFRAVTGTFPYAANDIDELVRAHEKETRISLLNLEPTFPAELAAVIEGALDPEPCRRPQSAHALADAITSSTS